MTRRFARARSRASPVVAKLMRFQTILATTGSVVGTKLVQSALGFVYWWVAVRAFSPESTGLAVAAISAMALLGGIALFGVATSVVGVLPSYRGNRSGLILAAFLVSGGAAVVVGVGFAVVGPVIFPSFRPLGADPETILLFAVGVLVTTLGQVMDTLLVGVLRGSFQLLRNFIFASFKLAVIVFAAGWFGDSEATIYATWVAGEVLSLVAIAVLVVRLDRIRSLPAPEWRSIFRLGPNAFGHHVLNQTRFIPALITPILVAGLLSPEANAEFYVILIVTGTLQIVAAGASFTLYAVANQSEEALHHQLRVTLGLSLAGVTAGLVLMLLAAPFLLSLFGWTTSTTDFALVALLGAAAYPMIVKDHWTTLRRLRQDVRWAALVTTLGAVLEVALAAVGAVVGGLVGLAAAWLVGIVIQAVLMTPFVWSEAGFPGIRSTRGARPAS